MSIMLDRLTKRYGSQTIVEQVSLEVADGELFVLLGASGSGKSTVLRLIAGLTQPDSGSIILHGRDVTRLSPQQRGVGFVFQNYSIFRHMTLAQNIEFGLRIRKVPVSERLRRRDELLDLVGLAGLGDRYPHQISGGQQQRVALARALAYEPSVLLLDEPFGALDVKIRSQLRRSLKRIQRRLGVTTILVTHDQEEAFELADRIGIIEHGQLLEVGSPEFLYTRPSSLFTATFLGLGTVLVGRAELGQACFGSFHIPVPIESPYKPGDQVHLLFRPEQIALSQSERGIDFPVLGQGCVVEQIFAGDRRRVRLRLPRLPGVRQVAPSTPFGEQGLLIDAVVPTDLALPDGELWVGLRSWHLLKPSSPRLLFFKTNAEPDTPLTLVRWISERCSALLTILGVAESTEEAARLQKSLHHYQHMATQSAELHLRIGNPLEQLAAEQAETLYELLVVPAASYFSSHFGLNSSIPTLLEQVGSRWLTPVLLVRGERTTIFRILICTAAGEPGKSDVRIGGWLASRLGAHVTLLYVTSPQAELSSRAGLHLERAVATLHALEVPCTTQTRSATTPAEGILAEAREGDYDLVVIGGHGPLARSLFARDDVALQVAAHIDRSLLVVPDDAV